MKPDPLGKNVSNNVMKVSIINPKNKSLLTATSKGFVDPFGNIFPIINGVARISELENYTDNFGMQWNKFDKTQLDNEIDGLNLSPNSSL